ncbi:FecR domain-containing protein, partial [Candidatus Binatia bacterium]|nr:FecR domain-containing protein [Candidatus Binatia bacterium]
MQHATTRGSSPARRGLRPRALVLCALGFYLTAVARPAAAADAEPRVARVAFVAGEASYLNADADEWTAVDVNAPLVTGDRFWSGDGGRAELQLPGGVYARLSNDTEIELLEVSDQAVQVKVGVGTATFRLREVPAREHVEFSTPTTAVVARSRGIYRIDVAEDGQTTVAVRDGEADAYLGEERYRLERGRGARIVDASYVTDDVPPIEVFDATQVPSDPWDDWETQRAARLQNASSYQYVDADVYGAEDLDDYGSWDRHETYGPIWRPTRVAAGWSPFTQGRWVWQDPWGWTWVDYEPWGWAPSHYGRWVYVQDAWAWAPGPVVARPAYVPATVGFLGVSVNTPSVSVSVGIGPSVGWVPLGWGEPVIPWWGGVYGAQRGRPWWGGWGGPRVVNNTVVKNVTNINVNNISYTNIDRGFYAVSRDSFVRGDLQRIDVPREHRREAFRPLRGAPDVIPARDSLFAARPDKLRGGRGVKPPQDVLQRAAVSTRDVHPARPDFARKLQLIERDKGAPVAPQQLRQLARQNAPREQAS